MYRKDFRSYINTMDSKERRIFLHGFLTAADAFSITRPLNDDQEAQKWALNQLVLHAIHEDDKKRETAQVLLRAFSCDKWAFRAMILHRRVDDYGRNVDAVGAPTDSPVDWPFFVAILPDGREIDESAYDALSEEEQRACKKVRCVEMTSLDGKMSWLAREDDLFLMQEMLVQDILIGDPINSCYMEEVLHCDGALRHLYCGQITTAFMSGGLREHMADITPMATAQANHSIPAHIEQAYTVPRPYSYSAGLDSVDDTDRPDTPHHISVNDGTGCDIPSADPSSDPQ